jgi:nucleotide-binding universal stress UspA family protein
MKILIATDGSKYSNAAVDECCRMILNPERDEVQVVSVYENAHPITAEPFALSQEYYEKLDETVHKIAAGYVEEAQRNVSEKFPKLKLTAEILHGAPDQQIIERAKEWNADLIVVGSHGRGFWGRLLGSVSDGVVHHAPCSVLVVRKNF